ncbi:MAG: 50S ribosomal protein L19 [Alphaproteobacteria bacterium]|nr:50S ribosomal protein L19 [Rickettsiales bacterium]
MSVSQKAFLLSKKIVDESKTDLKHMNFRAGDSLAVDYKIKEGVSERVATFRGVCIKRNNKGHLSNFILRKITKGIGIEKTILPYSPLVVKIKVEKRGRVRRAVLYYLRNIKGAIKIKERFVKSNKSKKSKKA